LLPRADALPRVELIWAERASLGPRQTGVRQTGVRQTGVRQTGVRQTGVRQTGGWRLEIVQRPGGRGQWLPAGPEPPHRCGGLASGPYRIAGLCSARSRGSGGIGA
jgi:hypothetical protein